MALPAFSFSFPLHLRQTPLPLPSHSHWCADPLTQSQRKLNQVRIYMHVFYSCKQFTCLQECYVILIALNSILLNLLLLLIHFFLTCWFCVKVIQFCLILFSFFYLLILFCCFQTSKLRWDSLTEMPACYELM